MPTALIVEDEPEANKLLAMLVQLRGYRTDSAYTGGEALAKIDRDPPDIVFLDLMLPDINGYEVCKALKTCKATSLIPVVMVTARVAADNRLQSYRLGADQYVPKPYTPDQIFQAMAEADDWRNGVDRRAAAGEVRFGARDDGEAFRRLAQVRSLLLARTPLDNDAVSRLTESLQRLAADADAWGQARGAAAVAALDYRTFPDRLVLTLRDLAGWFQGGGHPLGDRWAEAVAPARFDEVAADPSGGAVTLVKRFPAGGA